MTGTLPAVQVTPEEEEEVGGRFIPTLAKQKQASDEGSSGGG